MKKIILFSLLIFIASQIQAQNDTDAFKIKDIYSETLTKSQAYPWLYSLTTNIGGRISGSPEAMAAVEYTRQMLDTLGLDSVWIQPCYVPHWERGDKEQARIVNSKTMGTVDLTVLALGNSIGTGNNGITAEVIEVQSLDEVEKLGRAKIEGKIVFFNRPADVTQINTFAAYGGMVDQRVHGPAIAANFGAVGAIVRSATPSLDDVPHTGVTVTSRYNEGVAQIPSVGVSTIDAELLSRILKQEKGVRLYFRTTCGMMGDKLSYNVIGEIKGSEFPNEIILVGGHLDSWDVGQGAHDDGTGVVHAMATLQMMKAMNYQPQRTIRCVLFMNEENGQQGSTAYANASNQNNEFHLAAIESDRGGFTPRGFECEADSEVFPARFAKFKKFEELLNPYGLDLSKGGSGADVSRLKSQKGLLIGFIPDSQRYFDFHHTANDNIEAVNKRELDLGVAAIFSLVYLIDLYGL
jgi:carboxypeptidase Q